MSETPITTAAEFTARRNTVQRASIIEKIEEALTRAANSGMHDTWICIRKDPASSPISDLTLKSVLEEYKAAGWETDYRCFNTGTLYCALRPRAAS